MTYRTAAEQVLRRWFLQGPYQDPVRYGIRWMVWVGILFGLAGEVRLFLTALGIEFLYRAYHFHRQVRQQRAAAKRKAP